MIHQTEEMVISEIVGVEFAEKKGNETENKRDEGDEVEVSVGKEDELNERDYESIKPEPERKSSQKMPELEAFEEDDEEFYDEGKENTSSGGKKRQVDSEQIEEQLENTDPKPEEGTRVSVSGVLKNDDCGFFVGVDSQEEEEVGEKEENEISGFYDNDDGGLMVGVDSGETEEVDETGDNEISGFYENDDSDLIGLI